VILIVILIVIRICEGKTSDQRSCLRTIVVIVVMLKLEGGRNFYKVPPYAKTAQE
jgi:hypothetical protein